MTGLIIYLPPPRSTRPRPKEAQTACQERLPEYHVKARNTSVDARRTRSTTSRSRAQYGFRGALVPGVTVYAYLTHPLVEAFGAAWLERGTATVRFLKPIHDGEEVRLDRRRDRARRQESHRDGHGVHRRRRRVRDADRDAAGGLADAGEPRRSTRRRRCRRSGPLATREHWASLDALGTPVNPYDEARAAEYLERVSDGLRALSRRARLGAPRLLSRPGQQGALARTCG